MNVKELKEMINDLDDNVEVEVVIEGGFSSMSCIEKVGGWFDEDNNKFVIEGEDGDWD